MLAHVGHRAIAVLDRENAEKQVTSAAPDCNGEHELAQADTGDAGEQHENLEGGWRRQQRWNEHGHHPVAPQARHRAFDVGGCEPLADERLAAFPADEIHHEAAGHRSQQCGHDVHEHARLVPRDHVDDEQVRDFGKRQERRIKKRDDEEPRGAKRQRERTQPVSNTAHRTNT